MKLPEAVEICEAWFAYLDRQKARATELAKLSVLARTDASEAQRRLRQIDNSVTVYDGGRLEPAVRLLVKLSAKRLGSQP